MSDLNIDLKNKLKNRILKLVLDTHKEHRFTMEEEDTEEFLLEVVTSLAFRVCYIADVKRLECNVGIIDMTSSRTKDKHEEIHEVIASLKAKLGDGVVIEAADMTDEIHELLESMDDDDEPKLLH